jgi:hypothetical protein
MKFQLRKGLNLDRPDQEAKGKLLLKRSQRDYTRKGKWQMYHPTSHQNHEGGLENFPVLLMKVTFYKNLCLKECKQQTNKQQTTKK